MRVRGLMYAAEHFMVPQVPITAHVQHFALKNAVKWSVRLLKTISKLELHV